MTWHSNDLTARTNAPDAIYSPAGYPFLGQKTQHVVYQGFGDGAGDGHVHELWWDGTWHHNDVTSQSGAPPIDGEPRGYVYEDQPGGATQHVIYQGFIPGTGPDGRVQEIWWDDDKHSHTLTGGNPALVDRPFGYSFEGGQHIAYRAADNTLRFLDFESDFGWTASDLSPYMAGHIPYLSPAAYGFAAQGTHHIVFAGTDRHIHELWKGPSGSFHHNDLTLASGASALAESEPFGFANNPGYGQVVSFVGQDGHLHQFSWYGGWQHQDLTATVGGVPPSAGAVATGYLYPSEGTLHVNYLGVDSHIHEYWQDDYGWHPNDLTVAAGVLVSRSNPTAYALPSDDTQHVVFVDDNRHVVELYWLP